MLSPSTVPLKARAMAPIGPDMFTVHSTSLPLTLPPEKLWAPWAPPQVPLRSDPALTSSRVASRAPLCVVIETFHLPSTLTNCSFSNFWTTEADYRRRADPWQQFPI